MKSLIFSIHDSKADAYLPIFLSPNEATGIRMFAHGVNNPEQSFSMFPADYTLFLVGEFDQETGNVSNFDIKKNLGNGITHQMKELTNV